MRALNKCECLWEHWTNVSVYESIEQMWVFMRSLNKCECLWEHWANVSVYESIEQMWVFMRALNKCEHLWEHWTNVSVYEIRCTSQVVLEIKCLFCLFCQYQLYSIDLSLYIYICLLHLYEWRVIILCCICCIRVCSVGALFSH